MHVMYVLTQIAIVVGTSIWVFIDAKQIGVKKGQVKGLADLGPTGWLIACLGVWIISFPVYLAKRGEFMRANEKAGKSTPATIGGVTVIVLVIALGVLFVLGAKRESLEQTAKELVTQIIQQKMYSTTTCARVKVTEEVASGLYRATATLDNGNDLKITIEDQGDKVLVRIAK